MFSFHLMLPIRLSIQFFQDYRWRMRVAYLTDKPCHSRLYWAARCLHFQQSMKTDANSNVI